MFWLGRPPYLRWIAAAALLASASLIDLSRRSTVAYPFVAAEVATGAPVADAIEWRDIPVGVLEAPPATDGHALRPLAAGEPLLASAIGERNPMPVGWWSVPVDLPESALVGARVRLVAIDPQLDVEGVVTAAAETGPFATTTGGLVAVPPDAARDVAAAVSRGGLLVLVGT